jgi:N-acetylmuramoyl-L-alanine amidase
VPYATYISKRDGLSERTDLGGPKLSKVPKVFMETANMRNTTDAALIKSDAFRQQAAAAIAQRTRVLPLRPVAVAAIVRYRELP